MLEEVEEFIGASDFNFLYISRTNCSVCHALLPQIKDLFETNFPLVNLGYVNTERVEEIAGQLSVFTVPVLILFLDGKELIREARFVHVEKFKENISKVYRMIHES